MSKNQRHVVGLDIGTSKICCLIAERRDNGEADIVGIGTAPSRGLRKGVVVNLEATVEALKQAIEEAELVDRFRRLCDEARTDVLDYVRFKEQQERRAEGSG